MNWDNFTSKLLDACKSSFGETCVHKPAASEDTESFTGVFSAQTSQVNGITGSVVMTNKPRLMVKLADLTSAPVQGDRITIREIDYKVTDVIKDGGGGAELSLHKL